MPLLATDTTKAPTNYPGGHRHIAAGTLRMIGTTGAVRSGGVSGIPDHRRDGAAQLRLAGLVWAFAPATTPPPIVDKVSADTGRILVLADAKQRLIEAGAEPAPNTPEVFTEFVNRGHRQVARFGEADGHQPQPVTVRSFSAVVARLTRSTGPGCSGTLRSAWRGRRSRCARRPGAWSRPPGRIPAPGNSP